MAQSARRRHNTQARPARATRYVRHAVLGKRLVQVDCGVHVVRARWTAGRFQERLVALHAFDQQGLESIGPRTCCKKYPIRASRLSKTQYYYRVVQLYYMTSPCSRGNLVDDASHATCDAARAAAPVRVFVCVFVNKNLKDFTFKTAN